MKIFNSTKIILAIVILVGLIIIGAIWLPISTPKERSVSVPEGIDFSEEINLPKEDAAGKDLEDVPRYLPSVRLSYNEYTYGNALFVDIQYYTKETPLKVEEFYRSEMPKYDWKVVKEKTIPGVNVPFGEITIKDGKIIDFRKQDCSDPNLCLPYAKITLGEFKIKEEQYTFIGISYEEAVKDFSSETKTSPETSLVPSSEFGKKFNEFLKNVLGNALGEVALTSYSEGKSLIMEYSFSLPIKDVSAISKAIKTELIKKGIPEQIIFLDISSEEGFISVMSWEFFGKTGTLNINIYKDAKELDVSFVVL